MIPTNNVKYSKYAGYLMCMKRGYEAQKECNDYCPDSCYFNDNLYRCREKKEGEGD